MAEGYALKNSRKDLEAGFGLVVSLFWTHSVLGDASTTRLVGWCLSSLQSLQSPLLEEYAFACTILRL